jgi:thiamine-phosphate pyrophosphorylase
MPARQTSLPKQWLVIDAGAGDGAHLRLRGLPRGSGVIVFNGPAPERLRRAARLRGATVVDEASGGAARVHDGRELMRARLARTPLSLLSPIYPTASHPDWGALPRMRAAALARLAGRQLVALGGMDARRFGRVAPLGFVGWAGISAFQVTRPSRA